MFRRIFDRKIGTEAITVSTASDSESVDRIYKHCVPVTNSVNFVSAQLAQMQIIGDGAEIIDRNLNDLTRSEFLQLVISDLLLYGVALVTELKRGATQMCEFQRYGTYDVELSECGKLSVSGLKQKKDHNPILICHLRRSHEGYLSVTSSIKDVAFAFMDAVAKIRKQMQSPSIPVVDGARKITPNERRSIAESLKGAIDGSRDRDKTGMLVLDDNFKLSVVDLAKHGENTLPIIDQLLRLIASSYGVPPFQIGADSDSKYSNQTARAQSLNRNIISPLCTTISDGISKGLGTEFKLDFASLLRGDVASQIESADRAVSSGIMTVNEAREMFLGLKPVEGGDELLPSSNSRRIDTRLDEGHDRRGEYPSDDGRFYNLPN